MMRTEKVAAIAGGIGLLFLFARKASAKEPGGGGMQPGAGGVSPGDLPDGGVQPGAGGLSGGDLPPPTYTPGVGRNYDEIVSGLISPSPQPDHFYQIVKGDNPTKIVRAAYQLPEGSSDVVHRIVYTSSSVFNLSHYGCGYPNAANWPSYYAVKGDDGNTYDISCAFYPRSDDVAGMLRAGRAPTHCKCNGWVGHYGLLWIPGVNLEPPAEVRELMPELY